MEADQIRDGDILVGHSLPITPSLLLDKKVKIDEGRFLDFCTLTNALILHDRLITLRATVSDDIRDSILYQYLVKKKILKELEFSHIDLIEEHRFEMFDLLRDFVSESEVESILGMIFYSRHDFTASTIEEEREINHLRSDFVNKIISTGRTSWTFENFNLPISHDREKIYRLRTAEYWEVSSMLGLPFLPDFMRIPIIGGYNARVRQNIRLFIERSVDNLVRNELESALAITFPMIIPIPNAVSIFLNRYYSTKSIEESFDSMREEFADERKAIVEWEKKIKIAGQGGYEEMLGIMREITLSLNAMIPVDKAEIASSVTPGLLGDALQGIISPVTASSVIKEGLDIIKRWKQRKRISYFNNGKIEASRVKDQHELLKHAFGSSLTSRQIDRYDALTRYLNGLTEQV